MSLAINTNLSAINARRLLGASNTQLGKSLARLSSGSKIVSPEDDSAGLAQSIKLNNESLRDQAANQILANGISFLQTKDGFLQKVQKALDRMSELSVLALDATKTNTDRSNYNAEFQTLIAFINDIGGKNYNGKSLFYSEYTIVNCGDINWTVAKGLAENNGGHLATITSPGEQNYIQEQLGGSIAANVWIGGTDEDSEGDFKWITGEPFLYTNWAFPEPNNSGVLGEDYTQLTTSLDWNDLPDDGAVPNPTAYLLETGPSLVINGDGNTMALPTDGIPYLTDTLATASAAQTALANVKNAIEGVARARGNVGAALQRAQSESEALSLQAQNLDAAVSQITDTDVAQESTNFARASILVQSGTAMLGQANLLPQSVLRLLG